MRKGLILGLMLAIGLSVLPAAAQRPTFIQWVVFPPLTSDPPCNAGEFSIWANITAGVLKKCQNGVISNLDTGGGGGTPGGSDTQVQFNDAGAFGGDPDFLWNKTTNVLTVGPTITRPSVTGNSLQLLAIGGADSIDGGDITLTAGDGAGTSSSGGDVILSAGNPGTTGSVGNVLTNRLNDIRVVENVSFTTIDAAEADCGTSPCLTVIPSGFSAGSVTRTTWDETAAILDLRGDELDPFVNGAYYSPFKLVHRKTEVADSVLDLFPTLRVIQFHDSGGDNAGGGPKDTYYTIAGDLYSAGRGQDISVRAATFKFGEGDAVALGNTAQMWGNCLEAGGECTTGQSSRALQGSSVSTGTVSSYTGGSRTIAVSSGAELDKLGVGRVIINTTAAKIYTTGTVSSVGTAAPPVVTGSGTAWATQFVAGAKTDLCFSQGDDDASFPGGTAKFVVPIRSIDSETSLTLDYDPQGTDKAWTGDNDGSTVYRIYKCALVESHSFESAGATTASIVHQTGGTTDWAAADTLEIPLGWAWYGSGANIIVQNYLPGMPGSVYGLNITNLGSDEALNRAITVGGKAHWGLVFNNTWECSANNVNCTLGFTTGIRFLNPPTVGWQYVATASGDNIILRLNDAVATTGQMRLLMNPTNNEWRFDHDNTTANAISLFPLAGFIQVKRVTAPATGAANEGRVYFNTGDNALQFKADTGAVSNTVQPDAGAANNFLTAISASGVISKAQPSFSNISGTATVAQWSPLTTNGDLVYHNGTTTTRLPRGADTQCLTSNATTILWGSCAGGGGGTFLSLTDTPSSYTGTESFAVAVNSGATALEFVSVTGTGSFVRRTGPTLDDAGLTGLTVLSGIDPAAQFAGSTAAVSGTGTGRIRYDTTPQRLQVSNSAVAYSPVALFGDHLGNFAATTSAQLASVLSDEVGSGGGFVRATDPQFTNFADFTAIAAPATPGAGVGRLYFKSSTKMFCGKDDAGVETCMDAGTGGGGDSITVATVAATDPDFIDTATIDFVLDTGATPDTIAANVVANSINAAHVDETAAYAFSSTTNTFTGATYTSGAADPADSGAFRLGNAELVAWESSPAGTDMTLTVNSLEQLVYSGGSFKLGSEICLDGTTPDANQTCFLLAGDPGAAFTITVPNATGAIVLNSTTITNAAGAGLAVNSLSLDVGAGTGLAVSANAVAFDFSDAGANPALGAGECRFSNEGASAAGWVCEGETANTIETRFRVTDPTTADRIVTFPDADTSTAQAVTCGGTDKVSAFNATTGAFTCSADETGAGGGDEITVNTTVATNANFSDTDPAAPGSGVNVEWQINTATSPDNISGYIQEASVTQGGVVNTVAQTFAGEKTFNSGVRLPSGVSVLWETGVFDTGWKATSTTGDPLEVVVDTGIGRFAFLSDFGEQRAGQVVDFDCGDSLGFFGLYVHDNVSSSWAPECATVHQSAFRGMQVLGSTAGNSSGTSGIHAVVGIGTTGVQAGSTGSTTALKATPDFEAGAGHTVDQLVGVQVDMTTGQLVSPTGTITEFTGFFVDHAISLATTVTDMYGLRVDAFTGDASFGTMYGFKIGKQSGATTNIGGLIQMGAATTALELENPDAPADNSFLDSPDLVLTGVYDSDAGAPVVRAEEQWRVFVDVTATTPASALTFSQGGTVATLTDAGTFNATTLTESANAVPNSTDHLGFFAATTSAQLAGVLSDETGTAGGFVRATDPAFTNFADFTAIAAPATPGAGVGRLYFKSSTKMFCGKDDAGVETCMDAGAGGGNAFTTIGAAVADTATDTLTITDSLSIDFTTTNDPEDLTAAFNYALTLAGNPALNAKECVFTTEGTSGGGFLCEGTTANTSEQLYLFPALDGADTTTFIALGASDGDALAGDSATAFFDTGTLEDARLSTNVALYNNGSKTWGAGAGFNWTFDAGATDPVFEFTSGNVKFSGATTYTFEGGATDPVWTPGNSTMNLSTGTLQQGGTAVGLTGACTNQFVRAINNAAPTCASVSLTADVSGILPGANGGTNNGFMDFTGPATTLKTFTLPNASATILTSNAAVTPAQGGTGANNTATTGRYLRADGTNFVTSAVSAAGSGGCTNQFARTLNDNAAPTCASVATADITDANVTPAKVSAPLKTRLIQFMLGADNGAALADTDDQQTIFVNRLGSGMTITEVWCESDGGTPSINLQRDDGTPANILSSNLSCPTSGASTTTFVAGESAISDTHRIDFVMVTAGGTAKRITLSIKATVD